MLRSKPLEPLRPIGLIPRLTHSETVLSGPFRFWNPALLHARMRLFDDRLELSGWRFQGRYFRCIRLQQILQADVPGTDMLLLWLSGGETIRLQVKNARLWRDAIEESQGRMRMHRT